MTGEAHIPLTLAAVCVAGGVIGYSKSRSVMSLVGGLGVGALFAGSSYLIREGEPEKGHLLGLGSGLMLAAMMGKRYSKTGAIMPAGALAFTGATAATYHGLKWNQWRNSNMVLQRGDHAVVWGSTDQPNGEVNLHFSLHGKIASTSKVVANATGYWSVNVAAKKAFKAGTGYVLTLSDSNSQIVLDNIAFGDVFLCSGQSNMEFSVPGVFNATEELADSHHANLRMFSVSTNFSNTTLNDVQSRSPIFNWTVSAPSAFNNQTSVFEYFSAVCYFTGRDLLKSLGGEVPIGMVSNAVGGSFIEQWSDTAALAKCPNPDINPIVNTTLSTLYNGMLHPILPMRFHFVLWYQGESNVLLADSQVDVYRCQFPVMVNSWRGLFNVPDLPFFFVQLAAFPDFSNRWAKQQITQTVVLSLPKTGMATAMDLGDPTNPPPVDPIHPRNKQTVGARLARSVLHEVYGRKSIVMTGPIPLSFAGIGRQPYRYLTLSLTKLPSAAGLKFNGTEQCGYDMENGCCEQNPFEILTAPSMVWTRATAMDVDGHTVYIKRGHALNRDTAVIGLRYAYQSYAQCALYNSEWLPMIPFIQSALPGRQVQEMRWPPEV